MIAISQKTIADLRACTRPLTGNKKPYGALRVLEEVRRIFYARRIRTTIEGYVDFTIDPSLVLCELQLTRLVVKERAALIRRVVGELPTPERRLIRMRYWEEVDMRDIGLQLQMSRSWAEELHASALKRLRRMIIMERISQE